MSADVMGLHDQVALAVRNYGQLPSLTLAEDMPEEERHLATPDRLGFALGWVVANAIVGARYADSVIDALPVYHPDAGWDRFLLTRRLAAPAFAQEPADSFGLVMVDGEDAPRITHGSGDTRLALGTLLRDDPDAALAQLLELFPPYGLAAADQMGYNWPERQIQYPRLYQAVTELVLENPGLVVAREIYVDDQPVDGAYHPLYLHGIALQPKMVYDWFLVQYGDRACFFRIHAGQSIYETERGGWSTVRKQLAAEESVAAIKGRIRAWLRIEGEPQPDTVD